MQITVINEKQAIRKTSGVYYHRLFTPHDYLANHRDIDVVTTDVFTTLPKELKESTDIAIFNGYLPFFTLPHLEMEEIKKYAKVVIMDVDDVYWDYKGHILEHKKKEPLSHRYPKTHPECVKELIGLADVITTPSEVIKKKIEKDYNKPCYILHNAIDTSIPQFTPKRTADDGIVWFGYLTNAMHYEDSKILIKPLQRLYEAYGDKIGVVMTGYNEKGEHQRRMSDMLSLNGKIKNFKRFDYKDFTDYATVFNEFDISLVPLQPTVFNKGKSILKVVESGLMKRPVIVSAQSPYLGMVNDYWMAHSEDQWFEAMSYYVENPEEIEADAELIYEQMSQYKIENQIDKRLELYKSLL